jgi:cbb3-type cytochrome oxidase maturation protein
MSVIYVLIALSLLVALSFLAAFLWAVRTGQYDDTHTPSMRMLFDERGHGRETVQTAKRSKHPKLSKRHNNAKE